MKKNVGAIIVAFYPGADFEEIVFLAAQEVSNLVIINNGLEPLKLKFQENDSFSNKVLIVENQANLGIAKALNKGLELLLEKNCIYFLLLDQDSKVPPGMVTRLVDAIEHLNTTELVAAVGPLYYNTLLSKYAPFIRFGKFTINKIHALKTQNYINVDFLITSGTLITSDAIEKIGLMNDDLFIDYVDTEWCVRALSKGYKLYGVPDVTMEHALGEKPIALFKKKIPMHGPLRHYYIVRNCIYLLKKKYIPINFRFIFLVGMLKTFFFYSLFPSNRTEHFKKMCEGVLHGLFNKVGRYDEVTDSNKNV